MIRFCDKEVYCVLYGKLDRSALLSWFFRGSLDELVCVLNPDGSYRGRITYYSLINSEDAADAVLEDYVVLDCEIWENARKFFAGHEYCFHENVLLPILDQAGVLVSFAYEDGEANREIRMLRELEEVSGALSFSDVYPQYDCVKILGCNELAVSFAKYLRKRGIGVITEGGLWQYFFCGDKREMLDYRCLTIYAEGVEAEKSPNWVENLLRSVSPEFECVDCIYEANIKEGLVTDAMGDAGAWLEYLRNTDKDVVIWGTGLDAQNVYDFLCHHGIGCDYFLSDDYEERKRLLFGKRIIGPLEMRKLEGRIVMLDCFCKNSAWGTDAVDYYDYLGFRRNKDLFAVRDYIEIKHNNLKAAVGESRILFIGDFGLCEKTAGYLRKNTDVREVYYADILYRNTEEVYENSLLKKVHLEDVEKDMLCMAVIPDLYPSGKEVDFVKEERKGFIHCLEEKGIRNYTDYFSHILSFLVMEEETERGCIDGRFAAKKTILGQIPGSSGNVFIKSLLDNHPFILTITDFSFFNNHLFWFSVKLADLPTEKLVTSFEKICQEYPVVLKDEGLFKQKMQTLLEPGKRYTSQEIFVILMISYVFMYGRDIKDVRDMVVYWEPHYIPRSYMEEFAGWLKKAGPCGILNVVRNICMVKGSGTKMIFNDLSRRREEALENLMVYPNNNKKDDMGCERFMFRFEDIKLHPRENLLKICHAWGIPWSETLMETTMYGEKAGYMCNGEILHQFDGGHEMISGFDLRPVYNTYEEYFSEYDRFRICLICAPWQKQYGYPYVSLLKFSRRELQKMFLKRFRMESKISFGGAESELNYRIQFQKKIRSLLWELRKTEFKEGAHL